MIRKTIIAAALLVAGFFAQGGAAYAASGHHRWHHASALHAAWHHHAHRHFAERRIGTRRGTRYAGRAIRHHWRTALDIRSPRAAALLQNYVASTGPVQQGRASFYSGGRTASGGMVGAATCAHRFLPFGTRVLVTNLANARQVVLTVNDRGPFVGGRILDVSRGAAGILGMLHSGVSQIRMQVLGGAG